MWLVVLLDMLRCLGGRGVGRPAEQTACICRFNARRRLCAVFDNGITGKVCAWQERLPVFSRGLFAFAQLNRCFGHSHDPLVCVANGADKEKKIAVCLSRARA